MPNFALEKRALITSQRPSDLRTGAYSSAARATPAASKSGVRVPANFAYSRTTFMGILSSAPIQLAYLPSLIFAQALPALIPRCNAGGPRLSCRRNPPEQRRLVLGDCSAFTAS